MKQKEILNKFRFEIIGGALMYCITNHLIHGQLKIWYGNTIGWQGIVAAVVFVIIISFYKGNIAIK